MYWNIYVCKLKYILIPTVLITQILFLIRNKNNIKTDERIIKHEKVTKCKFLVFLLVEKWFSGFQKGQLNYARGNYPRGRGAGKIYQNIISNFIFNFLHYFLIKMGRKLYLLSSPLGGLIDDQTKWIYLPAKKGQFNVWNLTIILNLFYLLILCHYVIHFVGIYIYF